jgi:hypothetical protein
MQKSELVIRGRNLSSDDFQFIKATINLHWEKGRSHISRVLCDQWDWRQPNGRLKDRGCRVLLLQLEQHDLITLPPRKNEKNNFNKLVFEDIPDFSTTPLIGKVGNYRSLKIEMVRRTDKEKLWDYLVHKHHYLGNPGIVGSYLKYIVYLDDQIVACLGWGAPAWRVAVREQFIGWDDVQKRKQLHLIINNVRFLILPWIQVKYLASRILATNIKMLPSDWHAFYGHRIVLLETFVDISRFNATCYRASNWIHVGHTKGTAKCGNSHFYHGKTKAVYLYPLTKDFKEQLTNE